MSYFDHFADAPGTAIGNWVKRQMRKKEFERIASHLPQRGARILEIGAGWGELSCLMRSGGYENYTAVEPNEAMREYLTAEGFATRNYAIPAIDEMADSYDAIILADVFEHLSGSSQAIEFLAEAHRVLRKGGILCIMSPDYLHWGPDFFNCDFTHSNITTVRRTVQNFHCGGFRTLSHYYFSGFISGVGATLVSWLIRACLSFAKGNAINSRFYKLKVTFLRQFLIIGQKISSSEASPNRQKGSHETASQQEPGPSNAI